MSEPNESEDQSTEQERPVEDLASFFHPNIDPDDLPGVFRLKQAQETLDVFSALFSGSSNSILVRILILQGIGSRSEQPQWTSRDLERLFSFLAPVKFNSALLTLKKNKLLAYLPEVGAYELSPLGRMALASLSTILAFGQEDGSEIGYITSQIAASQALGKVNSDAMEHLLGRLTDLDSFFDRALLSGSEKRIKQAEARLESVWSWVSKGTEVIESISADLEADISVHRLAQEIGGRQSKMLHIAARFQSELNLIEKNQVMIGRGVSTSDISNWLERQSIEDLVILGEQYCPTTPQQAFVLEDILADIAEDVMDAEKGAQEEDIIPPLPESEELTGVEFDFLSYKPLHDLHGELVEVKSSMPIEEVVPREDFATSSYRLSLLSLIGRCGELEKNNPVKILAGLPLEMKIHNSDVPTKIQRCGIEELSAGAITPTGESA
ncbi:hypothetical protein HTZ97_07285 [Desulfuromonas acetoxidans]|uniref:Uncharacterized protein n=1 Tax=Desulfuromonas acetoxidans (strain DSM 684 / 11070) TaxID=281689 RepID=Q1K3L2_DESA6|nr:hypothetical protein [Desulfuromonas acetoxidans]EAT16962.1 hypothetical protein Dace_2828 [Desulfuromonas acetoxidans DSM 684]MBF0644507.1 hypothetical protein [Desulfuromonas acetoxidans]NVD23966.1 hypothetical protein [Desulfuromonas acetoxidans]NVE16263.1 hypothetical protein [Desulfuromonas acetoxidans]